MTGQDVKKSEVAEPGLRLMKPLLLVVAAEAAHAIHAPLLLPNASVFAGRAQGKLYPARVS